MPKSPDNFPIDPYLESNKKRPDDPWNLGRIPKVLKRDLESLLNPVIKHPNLLEKRASLYKEDLEKMPSSYFKNDTAENYLDEISLLKNKRMQFMIKNLKFNPNLMQIAQKSKLPVTGSSLPGQTAPLPVPTMINMEIKTQINADNIAEFAYPLAQFVHSAKPDYILACDRGARILAVAVQMLHQQLYGALPTKDKGIGFRKISRYVPESVVRGLIRADVKRMLAKSPNPTVLVLDDWVNTGGTKDLVEKLFAEISGGKVNLVYGVMRGSGADISGKPDSYALGDWHDDPEKIGVDYDKDYKGYVVSSPKAISYRQKMSESISVFAKKIQAKASVT